MTLRLGDQPPGTTWVIDDVRLYDYALTPEDLAVLGERAPGSAGTDNATAGPDGPMSAVLKSAVSLPIPVDTLPTASTSERTMAFESDGVSTFSTLSDPPLSLTGTTVTRAIRYYSRQRPAGGRAA